MGSLLCFLPETTGHPTVAPPSSTTTRTPREVTPRYGTHPIGQSGWARPSGGRPTSRYGARATICENGYCTGYHYGTDMATGCGAGVFAASAGRVAYAGTYGAFGQHVRIDHGGGILTAYSHLQQGGILVSYGQQVAAGQLVAREGNSGLSRGCHLHFEVWRNGQRINPEPFMSERGISI
ncbi:M23 family metallopeptidase [Microbacterium sp. C448]|uniref:M23 family metallopeptidase n=1 Tax=Microbacterium sp. C448 TaxID=1177594 RepID=UPI0035943FD1